MEKTFRTFICVRMERGNLKSAIETVEASLAGKGWHNFFLHGTKAAVLVDLVQNPDSSWDKSEGRHDFGEGWYCFRSNMIAALSFAVDKSFPTCRENPCIIAFPEPARNIDNQIIDVNHEKIKDKTLTLRLQARTSTQLLNRRQHWEERTKNWKTALLLARWKKLEPILFYKASTRNILKGWLHDTKTTGATNNGADPQIDPAEWIQYCVKDAEVLGEKMLFIEFDAQWV